MSWRTVLPKKLTVAQLLIQVLFFCKTHRFITIFTTAWLTPSYLISSANLPSVLTHILQWRTSQLGSICLVHFKRHADTPKRGTKKVRHWQKTEHLKKAQTTPNQIQRTISLKVTLCTFNKFEQPNKKLIIDDKHNPQAKLPVLNWHNKNPKNHTRNVNNGTKVTV